MAEVQKKAVNQELDASKQAAMDALEKLLEAKEHFRAAAESAGLELKAEAVNRLADGKIKVEHFGEQACDYVSERPLASLAIAFVGGLVLSHLLSRK